VLAPTPTIGLPRTGDGSRPFRRDEDGVWLWTFAPIAAFVGVSLYRFAQRRKGR
jgi:hypothetical protein